jgi:hypothetical protein
MELELELIQTQMAQKPMLQAELYACVARKSNRKEDSVMRVGGIILPPPLKWKLFMK